MTRAMGTRSRDATAPVVAVIRLRIEGVGIVDFEVNPDCSVPADGLRGVESARVSESP